MKAVIYLRVSTLDQAKRNNELEGYSIPAQRRACRNKAHQLGATDIVEYVDRGVSARTDNRPALQALLNDLVVGEQINFVVVHKLDRLARNRRDDVAIAWSISQSGATLVSVTENIDETPQGQLMHGIFAAFSEFYSRNLSDEALKGGTEKARRGGTPYHAPIGYRNVIRRENGRDVRTVEVDPDRAAHITWAFEAYATGDYSGNQLCLLLAERGIATRRSREFPSSTLYTLLRRRYYLGIVSYRGQEYPGAHPPLVSPTIFARVQAVLDSRRYAAERPQKHHHYLKGSLRCGRCGSGLLYQLIKRRYQYFCCRDRHETGKCTQPYLPAGLVEAAIEKGIDQLRIPAAEHQIVVERANTELEHEIGYVTRQAAMHRYSLGRLKAKRASLLNTYLDRLITRDELSKERTRINREIKTNASLLAEVADRQALITSRHDDLVQQLKRLDITRAYQQAPPLIRRFLLQAIGQLVVDDCADHPSSRPHYQVVRDVRLIRVDHHRQPNIERLVQAVMALLTESGSSTQAT